VVKHIGPILVGHRGYPALYPENTLRGFRAALEAGARAIECDLQFSRDGQPIIIHDPTLKRTTGHSGRVVDFSAAELGAISAHEPERFGAGGAPEPLPTLTELVTLLLDFPQARLFVEIKDESFAYFSRAHCLEQVLGEIRPLGESAVIISFDAEVLELARQKAAAIGWVLKHYNTAARRRAAELSPEFLISNYRKLPAAPEELWPGDWQWFVYDIVDWPLVRSLTERGVVYIETWDIGSMLTSDKATLF
jgi:glycerophosphoryl diester phosphodiesterase